MLDFPVGCLKLHNKPGLLPSHAFIFLLLPHFRQHGWETAENVFPTTRKPRPLFLLGHIHVLIDNQKCEIQSSASPANQYTNGNSWADVPNIQNIFIDNKLSAHSRISHDLVVWKNVFSSVRIYTVRSENKNSCRDIIIISTILVALNAWDPAHVLHCSLDFCATLFFDSIISSGSFTLSCGYPFLSDVRHR